MEQYIDANGKSLVTAYETGADYIKVKFAGTGHIIKFSYRSAGKTHVDKMKAFAEKGTGLENYIEENIKVR